MAKSKTSKANTKPKAKATKKEPAKKGAAKQEAPKPEAQPAAPETKGKAYTGYKGRHIAGSRKEAVHKVFDDKGRDAAIAAAVEAGIKEGSAKSWCGCWQREAKGAEAAKHAPTKGVAG